MIWRPRSLASPPGIGSPSATTARSFMNRENLLPPRPPGHHREYVDPTEGMAGPGPRRIIIGQDGELYYTKDHYKSFPKLN
jgi:guanyl-specific ribonuclease Sa